MVRRSYLVHTTLHLALMLGGVGVLGGCQAEDEDGQKVVDALVVLNDAVGKAIVAAPEDWLTSLANGEEIDGQLEGATVRGWRLGRSETAATGFHQIYAEKYFIDLNDFEFEGIRLSGSAVVTRSNIDFGQSVTQIDDAVRRSVTAADLTAVGAMSPRYTLEIQTQSVANTAWTCGDVNGAPFGNGLCY